MPAPLPLPLLCLLQMQDYCDGVTKTCTDKVKPEDTVCNYDSSNKCDVSASRRQLAAGSGGWRLPLWQPRGGGALRSMRCMRGFAVVLAGAQYLCGNQPAPETCLPSLN